MKFYSYLWLRDDGTPYYVGKGSGRRAFVPHVFEKKTFKPPVDKAHIVLFPMDSEALALESEVSLIALFGRKDIGTGILRNLSDGGEGVSGLRHSDATKAKMRKPKSAGACRKMSLAKKGRPSPRKGVRLSPEQIERLSASHIGQKAWNQGLKMSAISEEHRRKIGEASRRMWLTRSKDGLFKSK
jgi:hypothetical protein